MVFNIRKVVKRMDSTIERIIQQGENVLLSMKDLKRKGKKKGKERADLYERFCANLHSFSVYTYINPAIEKLAELQNFQEKLNRFASNFESVVTNWEMDVDLKHVESTYEEVLFAYNSMVNALGLIKEN
jgi:hypothetical protein